METQVVLTVTVNDDTIFGEAKLSVARWDGTELVASVFAYRQPAVVQELNPESNVYPYAVAVLRDQADRAIAAMLSAFSKGEVLLMREAEYLKKDLGVGARLPS